MTHITFYDVNNQFSNILVKLRGQKTSNNNFWLTTQLEFIEKWGTTWRDLTSVCTLGTSFPLSHVKTVLVAEAIYEKCSTYSKYRLLSSTASQDALSILDELDSLTGRKYNSQIEVRRKKIEQLSLQNTNPTDATRRFEQLLLDVQDRSKWITSDLTSLPKYNKWHLRIASFVNTLFLSFYDYFAPIRSACVAQKLYDECVFLEKQELFTEECKAKALEILEALNLRTHQKFEPSISHWKTKIEGLIPLFSSEENVTQQFDSLANELLADRSKALNESLEIVSNKGTYTYFSNDTSFNTQQIENIALILLRKCHFYSEDAKLSENGRNNAMRVLAELIARAGATQVLTNSAKRLAEFATSASAEKNGLSKPKVVDKQSESDTTGKTTGTSTSTDKKGPPPPPPLPKLSEKQKSKYLLSVNAMPRKTQQESWLVETLEFRNAQAKFGSMKEFLSNLKPPYSLECALQSLDYRSYSDPIKNRFYNWLLKENELFENLNLSLKEVIKKKFLEQLSRITGIAINPLRLFWFDQPKKSIHDLLIEEIELKFPQKLRQLLVDKLQAKTNLSRETILLLWFNQEKSIKDILRRSKKETSEYLIETTHEIYRESLVHGNKESLQAEALEIAKKCFDSDDFTGEFGEERQSVFDTLFALSTSQSARNSVSFILSPFSNKKETLIIDGMLFSDKEEEDYSLFQATFEKFKENPKFIECLSRIQTSRVSLYLAKIEGVKDSLKPELKTKLTEKLTQKTGLPTDVIENIWFSNIESPPSAKVVNEGSTLQILSEDKIQIESDLVKIVFDAIAKFPSLYKNIFEEDVIKIRQVLFLTIFNNTAKNSVLHLLPKEEGRSLYHDTVLKNLFNDGEYDSNAVTDILEKYKTNEYFVFLYKTISNEVKSYFDEKVNSIQKDPSYIKDCYTKRKASDDVVKAKLKTIAKNTLAFYLKIPRDCAEELLSKDSAMHACTLLSEYSPQHKVKLNKLKLELIYSEFKDELPGALSEVAQRIYFESLDQYNTEDRNTPLAQLTLDDMQDDELQKFSLQNKWIEELEKELLAEIANEIEDIVENPEEREKYAKGLWYSIKGIKSNEIAAKLEVPLKKVGTYMFY
ncbi:MAG: hypothetical protein WC222_04950 [Parachlamydiales bacterium]|jgi:hypothetical protein